MSGAVRSIFNEKVAEKWSLLISLTMHEIHKLKKIDWKVRNIRLLFMNSIMNSSRLSHWNACCSRKKKKKKKGENAGNARRNKRIVYPIGYLTSKQIGDVEAILIKSFITLDWLKGVKLCCPHNDTLLSQIRYIGYDNTKKCYNLITRYFLKPPILFTV